MTEYRFYREKTGEWENVAREEWRWEAHYKDGTILKQFDENTHLFHQFREIDQERLVFFKMVHDNQQPCMVMWKPGRKLIHFYDRCILDFGGPTESRETIYCFGFEENGVKAIFEIHPDGTVKVRGE